MSRPTTGEKPSAAAWIRRGLLAIFAAVAGFASVKGTLAQVAVKPNPALAHELAPNNGQIAARLAWRLSSRPDATDDDRRKGNRLAREALRNDPTAVVAVATLGMDAQRRGNVSEATQLFEYSEKLSRRNMATQVWLAGRAGRNEDVAGVLRHFDIALRTLPESADVLFPGLTKAMVEPKIRAEMVRTLLRRPDWGEAFINYVSLNNPDPRVTVTLFSALQRNKLSVPEDARANAVNSLIGKQRVQDAWSYYAANHPGVDRHSLRSPDFNAPPPASTLFDWTVTNDSALSGSIQHGVFDFMVPATVGGVLVQQMQLLSPGSYRFEGQSAEIDQQVSALPYWTMTCTDGRELGRVVVPNSISNKGTFVGSFTVPTDCPAQILSLVARSSDAIGGVSGQILRAQLNPASPAKARP
jgi:hypothetical protein